MYSYTVFQSNLVFKNAKNFKVRFHEILDAIIIIFRKILVVFQFIFEILNF